jgi:hypothetical protein
VELDGEVAVAVPHDPHVPERAGEGPGLLSELAAGRRFRRFSGFDLPARELPEAAEEP